MVGAPGYTSGRSVLVLLPAGELQDVKTLAWTCQLLEKASVLVNFAVPTLEGSVDGKPVVWIGDADRTDEHVQEWMKNEAAMAALDRPIVLDRAIGVKGASYDGMLVPGGAEMEPLCQSSRCMDILTHMFAQDKVVGTVGGGLRFLVAHSEKQQQRSQTFLQGRKICKFADAAAKMSGEMPDDPTVSLETKLREIGAIFTPSEDGNVVVDGNLVTASSRGQVTDFSIKFVTALDPQNVPQLTSPAGVLQAVANIA